MQKLIQEFFMESIIPEIRGYINEQNKEETIKLVVGRANKDVMIGARYKNTKSSKNYCDNHSEYQKIVIKLIKDSKSISSRVLIKNMCNLTKELNIGLIQKLVNMSVKYLYAIQNCGVDFELNFNIDEESCDCPLDSKILKHLEKDTNKKYTSWTKLEDIDDYIQIQDDIHDVISSDIKYLGKSRLEYDFVNWCSS